MPSFRWTFATHSGISSAEDAIWHKSNSAQRLQSRPPAKDSACGLAFSSPEHPDTGIHKCPQCLPRKCAAQKQHCLQNSQAVGVQAEERIFARGQKSLTFQVRCETTIVRTWENFDTNQWLYWRIQILANQPGQCGPAGQKCLKRPSNIFLRKSPQKQYNFCHKFIFRRVIINTRPFRGRNAGRKQFATVKIPAAASSPHSAKKRVIRAPSDWE